MECRSDLPNGCPRCHACPSAICCELCNPESFERLMLLDIEKPQPQPSRSRLNSGHQISEAEAHLRSALEEFRITATRRCYGNANLIDLGPSLVLPDLVLSRIIDCAWVYKLSTTSDIFRETRWVGSDEYGSAILQLVRQHLPAPHAQALHPINTPLSADALRSRLEAIDQSLATRTTQKRTCRACGASGHISRPFPHSRIVMSSKLI